VTARAVTGGAPRAWGELGKLGAFARRDLLIAWSYRFSFVSDLVSLAGLTLVFYFLGLLVDPARLPVYEGTRVTYLEFAVVGLALGMVMQLALERIAQVVRAEQLMGTLESLLMTPTSLTTMQLGSVAFDLVYVPLRTAVFLLAVSLAFGLHMEPAGIAPAALVLLAFIPFMWGLGIAGAAMILTFRRGGGLLVAAMLVLGLLSGVYFPADLLPGWIAATAGANPVAIAIEAIRDALLGGAGVGDVLPEVGMLALASAASLAAGAATFRLALRRERRQGTLGLY
jgi:ABC-2 type transport system permease protein